MSERSTTTTPAFPSNDAYYRGMSLRDWFAGQAIAGVVLECITSDDLETYARQAYRLADAMLEARKKEPG